MRKPGSPNGRQMTMRLDSVDKVAALLMTMPRPVAVELLKKFDDREIEVVARSVSRLPVIRPDVIQGLVDELEAELTTEDVLVGSIGSAKDLIVDAVSEERVTEIISEIEGRGPDRVWTRLDAAPESQLLTFIQSEPPQISAIVISKLKPELAAGILDKLSAEVRCDLSRRLLNMKPIGERAMRLIAERLSANLLSSDTRKDDGSDRYSPLTAILNNLKKGQIAEVIRDIGQASATDAAELEKRIFVFEDLVLLKQPDRVLVFDSLSAEQIVQALFGTDEGLRCCVLEVLSPRSRRIVEAEIAAAAKVPDEVVIAARRNIVSTILKLAAAGQIELKPAASVD